MSAYPEDEFVPVEPDYEPVPVSDPPAVVAVPAEAEPVAPDEAVVCVCGCICGNCTHAEEDSTKPLVRARFEAKVSAETATLARLNDYLHKRYAKPTGRSTFVVVSTASIGGDLKVTVDYQARGANTNDVRRRIKDAGKVLDLTFTAVSVEQVAMVMVERASTIGFEDSLTAMDD